MAFTIADLVHHFEQYAIQLKDIAHQSNTRNKAFFHVDIEELQEALTNGAKFPALYLQTPEAEKQNVYDSVIDQYDFTYIIIAPAGLNKAQAITQAKTISDKIYSRLLHDTRAEIIPAVVEGSNEGIFGPTSDGLYGWGVSLALNFPFDAVVNPNDWEDLL